MTKYARLRRPEHCNALSASRPYFEGWYFRHTSADGAFSFAVIPGMHRSRDGEDHSFIQCICAPGPVDYFRPYPAAAFYCRDNPFSVVVGESEFGLSGIRLRTGSGKEEISADIAYGSPRPPAPRSVMGPFSWLPLECNHGVLSLSHSLRGSVRLGGKSISMDGGTGYIEKDWGSSFPAGWVWLQGNTPVSARLPASFTCSIAQVPIWKGSLTGLIAILAVGRREYRFATYNAGRVTWLEYGPGTLDIKLARGRLRLSAFARTGSFSPLRAPTPAGMDRLIEESLDSAISVRLECGKGLLYAGEFRGAGIELVNTPLLKTAHSRRGS
ncbi:MAG: hypothetical protein GX549_00535 [Clostridiales bacterium]|nr:hypothetical protein [Clostridiales bacterium]